MIEAHDGLELVDMALLISDIEIYQGPNNRNAQKMSSQIRRKNVPHPSVPSQSPQGRILELVGAPFQPQIHS